MRAQKHADHIEHRRRLRAVQTMTGAVQPNVLRRLEQR